MMYMMNSGGGASGGFLLWGLHVLSVLAFFVGIVFLLAWAVKTFTHAQLKTWGIWLVVAGIIACLFTIGAGRMAWSGSFGESGVRTGMMFTNNRLNSDGRQGGGMMGISMNGMSMMLQGKTGDAFDEAFLQMMIPHHQGAIDMAREALTSAKHEEIKAMAREIISSQQEEIDQMQQWQGEWGYTQ